MRRLRRSRLHLGDSKTERCVVDRWKGAVAALIARFGDRPPILCLVTNRQCTSPVEQARAAVQAGIDLIQIREGDLEAAELAHLVAAVLDVTRGSATRVVVNDRFDVAVACGADGVHLRTDSMPPATVRSIAPPEWLIGCSVHGIDEAVHTAGFADYLIAGTIFPTSSKPSVDRFLGERGLTAIVKAVRTPVLAIGGVTIERLPQLAATGAVGIAAMGLFRAATPSLVDLVETIRARFDRLTPAS